MEPEVAIHPLGQTPGIARMRRLVLTSLCALLLAGCGESQETPRPVAMTGVMMTGIDHLADHLSVQGFYVDGSYGAQAGKGGSVVCCGKIPEQWQPGTTVTVRWNVTNWRDCLGEEHEAVVPVEPYDEIGRLVVHFFPDNKVRAVVSNYAPWSGAKPGSQYPIKDPIPQKKPWKEYPPRTHCAHTFK